MGCHRVNNGGCGCGPRGTRRQPDARATLDHGRRGWASAVRDRDPCVRQGTLCEMRGALCPRVVGTSFRSAAGSAAAPHRFCTIRLAVLSHHLDHHSGVIFVLHLDDRFSSQIDPFSDQTSDPRFKSDPHFRT